MTTLGPGNDSNPVSAREMYSLMNAVKTEILNEVRTMNDEVDKRFDVHKVEHEREKDQRNGIIRWAVTSIISGTGVMVAIYLAAKGQA